MTENLRDGLAKAIKASKPALANWPDWFAIDIADAALAYIEAQGYQITPAPVARDVDGEFEERNDYK